MADESPKRPLPPGVFALLTPEEVAVWLRLPKDLIFELAQDLLIPFVRVGPRQIRFRRGEVEAWLDRNMSSKELKA